MSSYTLTQDKRSLPFLLFQALMVLAGGTALFVVLLVALVVGYGAYHSGVVYPGVSVAGIDLSGLSPAEAGARLVEGLQYPKGGKIAFMEGDKAWVTTPEQLGLYLDPENSALAAYSIGRKGDLFTRLSLQFNSWYRGTDLPPLLIYDERAAHRYFQQVEAAVNLPTIEATLSIEGIQVVAKPGQVGRRVDVEATLVPVENQMRSLTDAILPVVIVETPPQILDATAQAQVATQILSAPLKLSVPDAKEGDPGPWEFTPDQLAPMIRIERVEAGSRAEYQVRLEAEGLRAFLEEVAPSLVRVPANPRFIFNDETHQLEVIQPAVIGRSLNVDETIKAINESLPKGTHDIALSLNITPPPVTDDMTAEQLGIKEVVSNQTSYFFGSGASRIQNIKTASSRFHGVLVAPGETFSMAEVLGDVSLDTGYAEALIIYNNRTIQGVGGGVCQVSTTLFRTVFFGGFPVVERHPHAYRVGYYEMDANRRYDTRMAGLDATVYVPVVDFKFKNDTPYWLLMETYMLDNNRLQWKFYSTSDGRKVEWSTTGLQNIVDPPPPLYEENSNLAAGEIKQVDWEVRGADVSVSRQVIRDGQTIIQDTFTTHYLPWRSVYQYGPGTEIPTEETPAP